MGLCLQAANRNKKKSTEKAAWPSRCSRPVDAQSIFTWPHLRETLCHILATFHSGVRTALLLCPRVCSGTTGGNRQSTGDESGCINAQPPIFQWRVLRRQHSFPESPQKECAPAVTHILLFSLFVSSSALRHLWFPDKLPAPTPLSRHLLLGNSN